MMKYQIGIIGGGFVGKATKGFSTSKYNACIYDLHDHLCHPLGTTMKDIYTCKVVFVCVPTPMNRDGSCHISLVKRVVSDLLANQVKHVIIRSTVPIGMSSYLNVSFMPEFLTEKNWETDFLKCATWVIGCCHPELIELMTDIIQEAKRSGNIESDDVRFVPTNEAESIKYFRNCFLATKVSFFNEMYQFCKQTGVDYNKISGLVGLDPRIGSSHIDVPGHDGKFGFGGTCFPKDLSSLIYQFEMFEVPSPIIHAVQERNLKIDRIEQDWKEDTGRAVV